MFDIRWRIMMLRMRYYYRTHKEATMVLLKTDLDIIDKIGVPKNNEEMKLLQSTIASFDETIVKLEEHVRNARSYCEVEKTAHAGGIK